jgi:pimeloyl-ACP methyl ester carboxylesterase
VSESRPFIVNVPDERLARIRSDVENYEWHEQPEGQGWEFGTNLDFMKSLQKYWLDEFDWRRAEGELNAFPQFVVDVEGLDIHYHYEKGSGSKSAPLLLVHGWPGSTFEFLHLVAKLAHPERFGGDAEDAFDVIVPSLPGFGFSGKPKRPIGPRAMADLLDNLMVEQLGYSAYFAQGGDAGSAILAWLGFDHPDHCRAIHLNMVTVNAGGDAPGFAGSSVASLDTDEEQAWGASLGNAVAWELGYMSIMSTRPQTLSYAMMDSPIGLAAWIVEKFHAWSDRGGKAVDEYYTKDQLLTNIMIYLVTRSANTASWNYRGVVEEGLALPRGERVEVPVAIVTVPTDVISAAPRSHVEKAYNVQRWTDFKSGGHFTALEAPEALRADVVEFFRPLRNLVSDQS